LISAGVAELADAEDLKSSALKRLVGSRPSPGTSKLASDLAFLTSSSVDIGNQSGKQNGKQLVSNFLKSRREGLSFLTIDFYTEYLQRADQVIGLQVTGQDIAQFLDNLDCNNGGKHAYYRVLRALYNWLYSPKSGYKLNPQDNPVLAVEAPKVEKMILPSMTLEQLDYLIDHAECLRDKAIISLFADSGLRLSELANVNPQNINWQHRLIKVWCKGSKEGLAPFGQRTEKFLKEWLSQYPANGTLWDITERGIASMLTKLEAKTKLPCNAHTFRRTFASILSKRGVDSLHIMRLGRWESIQMVERYTRSVKFDDSLKLYSSIMD
jgi:integrase/recombinase XerD